MTTIEVFLHRIAGLPEDPVPKLILADWLDDQSDGKAAAGMRLAAKRRWGPLLGPDGKGVFYWYQSVYGTQHRYTVRLPKWLYGCLDPELRADPIAGYGTPLAAWLDFLAACRKATFPKTRSKAKVRLRRRDRRTARQETKLCR